MDIPVNNASVPGSEKPSILVCWKQLDDEKKSAITEEIRNMLLQKLEDGEVKKITIVDPKTLALPFFLSSRVPDGFSYFYDPDAIATIRSEINVRLERMQEKKNLSWGDMSVEERVEVVERAFEEAKIVHNTQTFSSDQLSTEDVTKLVQLHHSEATLEEVEMVLVKLQEKQAKDTSASEIQLME